MRSLYEPTKEQEELDKEYWDNWYNRFKKLIKKRIDNCGLYPPYPGYVYLLECQSVFKIGRALNVSRRVRHLQGGNPFKIYIKYQSYFPDAKYTEHQLHKACFTRRVNNGSSREWFILDENDLSNIKEILDLGKITGLIKKKFIGKANDLP